MAGISMTMNAPYFGLWTLLPFYLPVDGREKQNNASGLAWVFALPAGWATLGPIISMYLADGFGSNYDGIGLYSAGVFCASAYVLTTEKI